MLNSNLQRRMVISEHALISRAPFWIGNRESLGWVQQSDPGCETEANWGKGEGAGGGGGGGEGAEKGGFCLPPPPLLCRLAKQGHGHDRCNFIAVSYLRVIRRARYCTHLNIEYFEKNYTFLRIHSLAYHLVSDVKRIINSLPVKVVGNHLVHEVISLTILHWGRHYSIFVHAPSSSASSTMVGCMFDFSSLRIGSGDFNEFRYNHGNS